MSQPESAFIKLARDRFKLAEDADLDQRKRELEDLRFYAGEQWDDDLLKSRGPSTLSSGITVPARPSLTINKTLEPVRQVLNQQRQSDLGYQLVPADDFGEVTGPIDHTEIELREGLVRRIQRDPEAEDARTWSFTRAAIAGRGYRVVLTRYLPGKRSDQEVHIGRIFNQNSVLLDPSREQPDGSDAEWGFYGTDMLWSAYVSEYGKSKAAKAETDQQWRQLGDEAPGWFKTDGDVRSVRVMNYYYTERESKKLYHLTNGMAAYDEELSAGAKGQPRVLTQDPSVSVVLDDDGSEQCHTQVVKSIKWCKINGLEVLEQTDWPGQWIPIIEEVGEELQPYDGHRWKQGVVRPMRDSCKGNNYIISKFVERVGLTPIAPIIMAGGQDEGYGDEWDAANTRTFSRLHYNQKDEFDNLAPPPFRADARAEIADIGAGVQIFGEAIQSTSVMPTTALGNTDASVKSGKLARALIEQGEQGTSNFMDNHKRSLRHEARVVNDLLYPVYGGRIGRMVRIVNGQGEMESVIVGQPFTMQGDGLQRKPVPVADGQPVPKEAKLYKLTPDADFNVAVNITKSIETRRQQIVQFLGELVGASPEQMTIIGDKLWKYLDLPDHGEIEERYKAVLDPRVLAVIQGGDAPIPPKAQQQIAMLTQQVQEMAPLADKNRADLDKAQLQAESDIVKARMEIESRERIAKDANLVKLTDIETKINLAVAQAMVKFQAEQQSRRHDKEMAMLGNAMDGANAEQAQNYELQRGEQGQQHALAQGDQSHQNALEQAEVGHRYAVEQAQIPDPNQSVSSETP